MTADTPQAVLKAPQQSLVLSGDWRAATVPDLARAIAPYPSSQPLTVDLNGVSAWDSRLTAQLLGLERRIAPATLDLIGAEDDQRKLLELARSVPLHVPPQQTRRAVLNLDGLRASLAQLGDGLLDSLAFLGAVLTASAKSLAGRGGMRQRELMSACYLAGPNALGIITLTSVLVGMILAYLGAAQLQQFGAAIYVADLVAVGMLREMGALMTAVVMAGRTGAAYAAQLSTMQGNEEIDAIRTLGINPMEFLVVPRVLALVAMMPLLVIFADALGIFGGAIVAGGMGVTPLQYMSQLNSAVSMDHFVIGLIKAFVFAVLIATAGCRAGVNAGRNSAAVGRATTDAVVTSVIYLIVADAAINILCQQLGY